MAKKYRHIGKVAPRKDAYDIVTGRAQYIDDVKIPRMLYGSILRSPYAYAIIKDIETSTAEAYPGVKAVLTYKNGPKWMMGLPPHRPLLDNTVRFVGDVVALVAAESKAIAERALDLIHVAYEQLPPVFDVEKAMQPDAPQLHPKIPGNIFPRGCPMFGPKTLQEIVMGDVEKGFREADYTAEGVFSYENVANPLPPEPPGAIAEWDSPQDLTVWTASQAVSRCSMSLQLKTGARVRAISTYCGGSYGSKANPEEQACFAAALAKATGRPVKVYYTKEEHFGAYALRIGSRLRAKIGIKKDGLVTALSGQWLVDTGASSRMTQGMIAVGCGEAQIVLRSSNWDLQPHVVCTNRNPSGVVRGFGGQELKSALLPLVAMALEKADLDPVDFFKANYVKPGDGYYWRDANWYTFKGVDYSKAIEKGADIFQWKNKWKGWGVPTWVDGAKRRGVGVGLHGNADVGEDEAEAYLRLNSNATAVLHACVSESGMGQRSSLCRMVAEVLNLPLENITVTPPDTLVNPPESGLIGSRGTYALGTAAIKAAEDARKKLFDLASSKLESKPEGLDMEDGFLYSRDNPKRRIPWREVLGLEGSVTGHGCFEADYSMPNFMMTFIDLEVDIETGKTYLNRVVNVTDCGQIIDPNALEGQLHGALGSAGIDTALFEETIFDKNSGHMLNCNLIDYKWRTSADLPDFQNVILETPFTSHRFKAIGVGEIATSPGPSAVMMAVYNAIGKRITHYPVTPDQILKAVGQN